MSEAQRYIEACGEYTHEYEHGKLIADWESKERVARKVADDFERRAGSLNGKTLLDAGFGNGAFAIEFARRGAIVAGLETNPVLLDIATQNVVRAGFAADLRLYDGGAFPFAGGTFDYVYSTSVLEHVSQPALFLREAGRVLKRGGRAYLSFPNRLAPRETHTGAYFLSYLPRGWAQALLRARGRDTIAQINLHFIGYSRFMRLLRGSGLSIVFEGGRGFRGLLKRGLGVLGIHHSALLRTIMVILEKR